VLIVAIDEDPLLSESTLERGGDLQRASALSSAAWLEGGLEGC
jgi:hypothetical protein